MKEHKSLENKLQGAQSEHIQTLSKESWDKVLIAWSALKTLQSQKSEKALFLQKHKRYGYGNKSEHYLTNSINNNLAMQSQNWKIKIVN